MPVTVCEYDTDERIGFFTTQEDLQEIDARKEGPAVSDKRLLQVADYTRKDPEMCQLIKIIKEGWPKEKTDVPSTLCPYFSIHYELATDGSIIFRGDHCIIPQALCKDILHKLHSANLGITGTVCRARESVYWPGMTSDIKTSFGNCLTCNALRTGSQPKETLQQHDRPRRPWAKVGVDLFS